jgi:FG-GAP-like repeat/WD40-like Beta Propeller Repeat
MKHSHSTKTYAFIIFALALFAALPVRAGLLRAQIVSKAPTGEAGNDASQKLAVSADGRYIAFESKASNLVSGITDTNNAVDIFLFDSRTNSIRCLSLNASGTATGNSFSTSPIITPDGRFVVFRSGASDLVSGDTNNFDDIFRYDTATNQIAMVSRSIVGTNGGNGNSGLIYNTYKPYDISDDGRYVAFDSLATDLTNIPDTNAAMDIFVRDMQSNTTRLITTNSAGTAAANNPIAGIVFASADVDISGDGRLLSFQSTDNNLVAGITDGNLNNDVFVKNLQTNQIRCATMGTRFAGQTANAGGFSPVMSKSGNRIVYLSNSVDIAAPDSDSHRDVFVYDIGLNANFLVSINSAGTAGGNFDSEVGDLDRPSISADGRYVVFQSRASDLDGSVTDNNSQQDVFRRDLATGTTQMVSVNTAGTSSGNSNSYHAEKGAAISNDGRFVVFSSNASSILSDGFPLDSLVHTFVRDMKFGNTFTASTNITGGGFGNSDDDYPQITKNGAWVVFASFASNLAAGDTNNNFDVFRAHLSVPQTAISDFDGDGKSDYAVWRPSSGYWFVLPNTGNYIASALGFGANGDIIAPADYSGDGRTDYAVFRPSNGTWYVTDSANFNAQTVLFGQSGDQPVPADYDGDGKADLAVFRAGTWYITNSSTGQITQIHFGLATDIPVAADYDGDGRADIAVFRSGVWYILRSFDDQMAVVNFGMAGDKPAAADYDSDGKTDVAVFRAGVFHILESRSGTYRPVNWGLPTDTVALGDYDGDGKSDPTVFRPSTGTWYTLRSSDNSLSAVRWGQSGDNPVASAFIP